MIVHGYAPMKSLSTCQTLSVRRAICPMALSLRIVRTQCQLLMAHRRDSRLASPNVSQFVSLLNVQLVDNNYSSASTSLHLPDHCSQTPDKGGQQAIGTVRPYIKWSACIYQSPLMLHTRLLSHTFYLMIIRRVLLIVYRARCAALLMLFADRLCRAPSRDREQHDSDIYYK